MLIPVQTKKIKALKNWCSETPAYWIWNHGLGWWFGLTKPALAFSGDLGPHLRAVPAVWPTSRPSQGNPWRRESWDRYPWICSRTFAKFLQTQLRGLGPFLPGNGVPPSTNYIWPSQKASEQGRVQRMPVFFGKYATLCRLWTLQPARVSFLSGSPHASFEKCSCRTWTYRTGTKFSSKGHILLGSCHRVGIWGEVFSCPWCAMIGIIFNDNVWTIY